MTSRVIEEQPKEINGHQIPIDSSKPNPNGSTRREIIFDSRRLQWNSTICTLI
jgi:hypothetical protein